MNRIARIGILVLIVLLVAGSVGWWLNRTSDLDGYTLPVPDQVHALFNPLKPTDLSDPIDQVLRLAIGPLAGVPPHQSAQFQDLLLAELGRDPDLELVERAELDRILRKTELGLANLANPINAAQLSAVEREIESKLSRVHQAWQEHRRNSNLTRAGPLIRWRLITFQSPMCCQAHFQPRLIEKEVIVS
jgi:hypothetical protein